MNTRLTKRQFLKLIALAGGSGVALWLSHIFNIANADGFGPQTYLPYISNPGKTNTPTPTVTRTPTKTSAKTSTPTATKTATPTATKTAIRTPTNTATNGSPGTGPKVIHVHASNATSWDFGDNYYGNYVSQDVVTSMVDHGLMRLTGSATVAGAWQNLIPSYTPGKAIAIKVNFNNNFWCDACTTSCGPWGPTIDALIHPINGVIHGLIQAYPNFEYSDIWVYDATWGANPQFDGRKIPTHFKNGSLYTGIRFFDHGCYELANYSSTDPSASIVWRNPPGSTSLPSMKLTDVLINAAYLINMPIIKRHGGSGVTLSFKNHYGSLANVEPLHPYWGHDSTYSPLVDIYRNPNILDKTVLTIADGLFGNRVDNISKPTRWSTFGNQAPNSLLFSADPVAIDCVMCDLLDAETTKWTNEDAYLIYADNCNLGVYERGDPWGGGYSSINYEKIEL